MIQSFGQPWPQTQPPSGEFTYKYPNHKTTGFLPPLLIPPMTELQKSETPDAQGSQPRPSNRVIKSFGKYKYTDWRGQVLSVVPGVGDTKDKFDVSGYLPKTAAQLLDKPYSTRDHYLIFGDTSQDYFRHGLQILDNINIIPGPEFWKTQISKETAGRTTLGSFVSTPFENSDPVIFGFDIIFDDISSPLLNGSINDFLQLFSGQISEIAARQPVYEEFKQQFTKFFKTRATVKIEPSLIAMTGLRPAAMPGFPPRATNDKKQEKAGANAENATNLFSGGKKAYMNYYLKKVVGLSKLIEGNTAETKSFLTDYNKDVITLTFTEDVSLSVGTLAHLYKLLYWSKPNAKTMIPENLLRFNCDIIVSEVRNFNRVRKSLQTGDIQVVKDNVSRYIYSLKECQFYFNTLPHDDAIDLGSIKVFDTYDIQFDYKYSSVKFEKFVPVFPGGVGTYVGYDGGAIWKVGNAGSRETLTTGGTGSKYGKSTPAFFTVGQNKFNENGVSPFPAAGGSPFIMSLPGKQVVVSEEEGFENASAPGGSDLDTFKQRSQDNKNSQIEKNENQAIESSSSQNSGSTTDITAALLEEELSEIRKIAASVQSNSSSESTIDQIRKRQYDQAREPKIPTNTLSLYNPPDGFQPTTTEEVLKKQKQGVKLTTNLRNSMMREAQTAINTRVGLLNKSLNKILNSVGITGVSPPKNIYTGTNTAVGRIFNDIRGQLIEFLGNSAGNLLQ